MKYLYAFLVVFAMLLVMELYSSNRCACRCDSGNSSHVHTTSRPLPEWEKTLNFTGFNNETGTADGRYIIPNYVHFIKFRYKTFNLIHMVCVLAAFKHQRPEKLFIHTDVEQFEGKNWQTIINTPGLKEVLVINKITLPTEVFGHPLNSEWAAFHGGDVARLEVMRQFGGIYLDNDSYLIRRMDDLRRYEMVVAWRPGKAMMNQVVLAHKDARLLNIWYEGYKVMRQFGGIYLDNDSYLIRRMDDLRRYEMVVAWRPGKAMMNQVVLAHKDARLLNIWYEGYKSYRSDMWYYNAGRIPALALERDPHLAHSVPVLLGTYDLRAQIYTRRWTNWRTFYSCHLMVRWMTNYRGIRYPEPITEQDVLAYNNTLLTMVEEVYPLNKRSRPLYTNCFI